MVRAVEWAGPKGPPGKYQMKCFQGQGHWHPSTANTTPPHWIQRAAGMSCQDSTDQGLCANVLTPGKVKGMLVALLPMLLDRWSLGPGFGMGGAVLTNSGSCRPHTLCPAQILNQQKLG